MCHSWSAGGGFRIDHPLDPENAYLAHHSFDEYAEWHLGLTEGASDGTKARYAFAYGDFRRLHRSGIIACHYRAAEWRHKESELAGEYNLRPGPIARAWEYWSVRLDKAEGRHTKPAARKTSAKRAPTRIKVGQKKKRR